MNRRPSGIAPIPGAPGRRLTVLRAAAAAGLLALILTPFLVPIPASWEQRHLLRSVGSQYHVLVPLVLMLLLLRVRALARRPWLPAAGVAVVFAAIEVVQGLTGRHARWQDFALDAAGIGLALCWRWWRVRRASPALAVGGLILVGLMANVGDLPGWVLAERLAASRFPLLADFETRRERAAWESNDDSRHAIRRRPDGNGRCLWLFSEGPSRYPGAILKGFPGDWRGYRTLAFSARAAVDDTSAGDLVLAVRLDDLRGRSDDGFAYRTWKVGPRWRDYAMDLSDLETTAGRPLELADVVSLLFYVPQPQPPGRILVDDVTLR